MRATSTSMLRIIHLYFGSRIIHSHIWPHIIHSHIGLLTLHSNVDVGVGMSLQALPPLFFRLRNATFAFLLQI
jgi:hypothetical protein